MTSSNAAGLIEVDTGGSAAVVAAAVWDKARADHTTAGSFGEYVNTNNTAIVSAMLAGVIDSTSGSIDVEEVLCRLNAHIRGRVVRSDGVGGGSDSDFVYYKEDDTTESHTNRKLADGSERTPQ